MTLGDLYPPKTTPISTFWVAFCIFTVGQRKYLKFNGQVEYIKSQTMDHKPFLKGRGHVT